MLRVLMIDESPESLKRTQAMLRTCSDPWELRYCCGSEAALDALSAESFDVVVADQSLAGASGAELLCCVRDLYPEAVRVLLCGAGDRAELLAAAGPAHQYLEKPIDVVVFREAVTRAGLLQKRLVKPGLQALVSQLGSLPSLPTVYRALVEEQRRPDASVNRAADLIATDLGMAAKVLQLINSSYFGLPVRVRSVEQAAQLLGINSLKPLVLSAGVFRQLEGSRVPAELLSRVFEHSLAVGCLAKRLAELERLSEGDADSCLLAGILHDIGKLVLADQFGREYAMACLAADEAQLPLLEAELEYFDASHADVGGYLLGLWGLPQDLIEAVALHHEPVAQGSRGFTPLTAVHVANALMHGSDAGQGEVGERIARGKVDATYLKKIGAAERWEAWAALVAPIAASTV